MKNFFSAIGEKIRANRVEVSIIAIVLAIAIVVATIAFVLPDNFFKNLVSGESNQTVVSVDSEPEPEPEPEPDNSFEIKMTFAGDTIIACYKDITSSGSFNEYANKKDPSYFLEKIKPIFEKDDFTFINLENVLSDKKLTPVERDYSPAFWFKSKASNVNILTSSSVEGVSFTNNHTNDYGTAGYNDTIATIKAAGLEYATQTKTVYFTKNDYKIAIICSGLWYEGQSADIIRRVKEASEVSDFQIVFFHGGTEKVHAPDNYKVRAARKIVDGGADLVIGSHPHVLQPREIYNGVEIIYSLGNFCYGGHRRPENRCVLYQVTLNFDKEGIYTGVNSEIIPCYVYTGSVNNYQPAVIENEKEKQRVLDFMDGKVSSPL